MSWAVSQSIESLGRELPVRAPQHAQPPGDGRGPDPGFQQRPLVELHVVGRHVERVHAEVPHVLGEVGQVPAVALDRVLGQEHVADPGHQRPGGRVGAFLGGRDEASQEGRDLFLDRLVALEDVDPLGDQRLAPGRFVIVDGHQLGADGRGCWLAMGGPGPCLASPICLKAGNIKHISFLGHPNAIDAGAEPPPAAVAKTPRGRLPQTNFRLSVNSRPLGCEGTRMIRVRELNRLIGM